MIGRSKFAVMLLPVLCLGLAACTQGGSSSLQANTTQSIKPVLTTHVVVKNYQFTPPVIQVHAGDEVTWTNQDSVEHNIKLLDGSNTLKDLPPGKAVVLDFGLPTTIEYLCTLHPNMRGKIVVGYPLGGGGGAHG